MSEIDTRAFTRRQLLLVSAAATAVACSGDPMTTADAATDVTRNDQPPAPDVTPDATTPPPDATTPPPDATMPPPDATMPPPDATMPPPDATTPPPDATMPPPDATPPPPDATMPPPDATSPPPDATMPPPDATPDVPAPMCPPAGAMRLGALSDFPMGSWRRVKAASVIVGRDARGLFAYSSVCTHRGCTVPAPASAMVHSECPCHGSHFDADGNVVSGPASRPLANYRVVVCGGDVYVQMGTTVPVGTRTTV